MKTHNLVGIILFLLPIGMILTVPNSELYYGELYAYMVVSPLVVMFAWPLILIPIFIIMGSSLLIPKEINPLREMGLLVLWATLYIPYLILVSELEHVILLQEFRFDRWFDLIYLYLICIFISLVIRLTYKSKSFADIYGIVIGFIGSTLIGGVVRILAGPVFIPGEPLQIFTFIIYPPFFILMISSFMILTVNVILNLRREFQKSPSNSVKDLA